MAMRVSFMYVVQSEEETIIASRVTDEFVGEPSRLGVARENSFIICLARIRHVWIAPDGPIL